MNEISVESDARDHLLASSSKISGQNNMQYRQARLKMRALFPWPARQHIKEYDSQILGWHGQNRSLLEFINCRNEGKSTGRPDCYHFIPIDIIAILLASRLTIWMVSLIWKIPILSVLEFMLFSCVVCLQVACHPSGDMTLSILVYKVQLGFSLLRLVPENIGASGVITGITVSNKVEEI